MKKENIKFVVWANGISKSIQKAKGQYDFVSSEAEPKRSFIKSICDIANDAIAKIEAEIEKLE